MFENILGLNGPIDDLRRDIGAGRLPQAILLSGPRYGGKSSVALETARALTCHGDGSWGCTCHACRLQRGLQHQDTVLVGDRYFELEIAASAAAFRREPRAGTAFLLARAVRKLLRRFDPFLWPDARLKKADAPMSALEAALEQIEPADSRDTPWASLSEADFTALVDTVQEKAGKLQQQLPHDPVPVDVVRAIGSWAHLSSGGGAKVVIVEEAHQLQDAARNAMLKLLEEPPSGVTLILTTSRRTAVIPTILSRVRVYTLPERTPDVQRAVQERIFRVGEPEQPLLQEFFRRQNAAAQTWRELAATLLAAADEGGGGDRVQVALREQLSAGPPRKAAEYLLDALLEELRSSLRQPLTGAQRRRMAETAAAVREHWERISTRNMNALSVIESLLISLQDTARRFG